MEKDKKYNIVLGLMIFFFILFVGVCLAWGLSYIRSNDNENSNISMNDNTILDEGSEKENTNINDTENDEKEKSLTITEIEKINKESVSLYLSAISAGSPEGRVQAIMDYESYEEMDSHYTSTVIDEIYKVTDIDYSSFTDRLPNLSQQLLDDIYFFKEEIPLFKDYNGKLAIYQSGWTGIGYEFVSQKLTSNVGSDYEWELIVKRIGPDEISQEVTCQVSGKIENDKYVLLSLVGI